MTYKKSLYISAVVGFIIASIMLFIGFQHNVQSEFYDFETSRVDIAYSLLVWFSWLIPSTIIAAFCGVITVFFIKKRPH